MIADIHKIKNTFEILLPKMFPMAIAAFQLTLANKLTTSSGIDVPKATIVSQITKEEILALLATDTDQSTKKSAPLISNTKPRANKI
jgi:hypothetical protein